MSLDDIKKLPTLEHWQTQTIVELAEVEITEDRYGKKMRKRFSVYAKGVYSHPLVDNGKPHLVFETDIITYDDKRCDTNQMRPIEDLTDYVPRTSL